ncbi:MAG: hypothetical protein ABL888_16350 [Pirellulaceae bacterium]
MRLNAIFLLLTGFLTAPASALDIVNGNFENPPIGTGTFNLVLPGWSQSLDGQAAGVWNIPADFSQFDAEAPEGTQIGYSNNLSMAQQSSRILTADAVALFAFGGRRNDANAGSFFMELWAGGTVVNGDVSGGTLLSSVNFDHTLIAPSSFLNIQTSYTPILGDPLIGQLLSVRFVRTSGVQMNMDAVRFNAVPEPSSAMAALIVGLVVGCKRRRRL